MSAFTITGTGFTPGDSIAFTWDSPATTLATVTAASDGSLGPVQVSVPAGSATGAHTISAKKGTVVLDTVTYTVDAAPSPTLSVAPTHGLAGSGVTLSGTNWPASTSIQVVFDNPTVVIATIITDGSGAFSGQAATIPAGASAGAHSMSARVGATGSFQASALYTVDTAASPTLTMAPTHGNPSSAVTFSGTNWPANQPVHINVDSSGGAAMANPYPTADSTGAFTSQPGFIPLGTSVGAHTAVGSSGATTASTPFTVDNQVAPTLVLTPNSGSDSRSVAFTGANWTPSTAVTLSWGQTMATLATPTADGSGNISGTLTIPDSGFGTGNVNGDQGALHATAQYTIAPPTLFINPSTGPPGTTINCTGTNWDPSTTVTIQDGVGGSTMGTMLADSSGNISGTAVIPIGHATGSMDVHATDGDVSADASFTVTGAGGPTLVLATNRGAPGQVIGYDANGYSAVLNISLYRSDNGSLLDGPHSADGSGHIHSTFIVPSDWAPGDHQIHAQQQFSNTNAVATFTVVAASLNINPVNGPPGTTFAFDGDGWLPGNIVALAMDAEGGPFLGNFIADANGHLSDTSQIPYSTTLGSHFVHASGAGLSANAIFTAQGAAALTVTPVSGAPSSTLHFAGSGFTPNALVTIRDAQSSWTIGPITVDANGNFDAPNRTGPGSPAGVHTLTATDSVTNPKSASCTFTVVTGATTFSATPTTGPPAGVSTSYHGTGFTPGSSGQIRSNIQSSYLVGFTVDSSGNFTQSAFSPSTVGHHTLTATDNGSPAKAASCTFDVVGGTSMAVNPTSGDSSASLAFSGSGFTPNSTVTIRDNQDANYAQLYSTDASGRFPTGPGSSPAPGGPPGTHTFTGTDTGSPARSAQCTFSKTGGGNQNVSPDRSSAFSGDYVGFTGAGWAPNTGIQIAFDGTDIASLTADSSGSINGYGQLPGQGCGLSPGTHTITARQSSQPSVNATNTIQILANNTNPLAGHSYGPPNIRQSQGWGWFRDPSCTRYSDADVQSLMNDTMSWLMSTVAPAWSRPTSAQWQFFSSQAAIPPTFWQFGLYGDAEAGCGCSGYHTVIGGLPHLTPLTKVFTSYNGSLISQQAVEITASHEAAEMICDPFQNGSAYISTSDGGSTCYTVEVADPVNSHGYAVGSRTFTDFVLPAWFTTGASAPYDYLGFCSAPFQVAGGFDMAPFNCGSPPPC